LERALSLLLENPFLGPLGCEEAPKPSGGLHTREKKFLEKKEEVF